MKCSLHIGKHYSIKHNTRSFDRSEWNKDEHIDYNRTHLNEVYINEKLFDFFDREFGNALVEYNEKNISKHPDRLIGFSSLQEYNCCSEAERRSRAIAAYYNEHKGKAQEAIIQLGNHDDYIALVNTIGQEKADRLYKEYLDEALAVWLRENPSFVVFHASAHLDEIKDSTPHLHIDFISVAKSDRGLSRKVSMDGALKNMGYERVKGHKYAETPYKLWLSTFRAHQEDKAQEFIESRTELKNLGLTVEPSEPSKASHDDPQDYKLKKLQKRVRELQKQKTTLTTDVDELQKQKVTLAADVDRLQKQKKQISVTYDEIESIRNNCSKFPFNKFIIEENELNKLCDTAMQYLFTRSENIQLKKQIEDMQRLAGSDSILSAIKADQRRYRAEKEHHQEKSQTQKRKKKENVNEH